MSTIRRDDLEALFEKALALPPDERADFLNDACDGNPALRDELDSLLAHDQSAIAFFDALEQAFVQPGREAASPAADPHALMGRTIGPYHVVDVLGRGGMGVVYKARDARLSRLVALKFLPPFLSHDDQARQRFLQEARAASALDHPNICTIYEIGETPDGHTFIAMACYTGETLKARIEQGSINISTALDYGVQIARGLAKAHAHDIVHRDVKPGNMMVTEEGIVKLLDFGLAKVADTDITRPGTTMGTAAYMSPEQAQGDPVDHRTDIWAFGVVFYEILTGRRPFRGDYEQAILYAILNEDPPPVTALNPDLPDDLAPIVGLCLEKQPALRYPSMDDVLTDLELVRQTADTRLRSAALSMHLDLEAKREQAAKEQSIVVLPFDDISPSKDNAYFSEGLMEEIISDLSHVASLRVISRTSAMMVKDTQKNTRSIGRELNVQYVLSGSVRKAGNNLRITAQLIDTTNDSQLWSEKYRGTLDDIFDIQETVSRAIVNALKLTLSPKESERLAEHPISDVHAYECYLRARHEIFQFTEEALDRALQHLENGLKIVGDNALLHAGIGYVHWQYVNTGAKDPSHLDLAETHAHKVFALDPSSHHGDRLLGLIELLRGNTRRSTIHLQRTLAVAPNDPDALCWYIAECALLGKPEIAEPLSKRLLKIDPLMPLNHGMTAFLHLMQGQFEEALPHNRKMYEMDDENPLYRLLYAQSLAYCGRRDDAYAVIDQMEADAPDHLFTWMALFLKYGLQGRREDALATVTPDLEGATRGDLQWSWFMATCYALLDEKEKAMDWLHNAVERGYINYPFIAELDSFLENVRGEPSFQALTSKVEDRWRHFAI